MFGPGFSLGFTAADIVAALNEFLALPVVVAVLTACLTLLVVPKVTRVVREIITGEGRGGGGADLIVGWGNGEYNDEGFETAGNLEGGWDFWQGGVGKVHIGEDEFFYSTDPDAPELGG